MTLALAGLVAGLIIGSFLATVAIRWPAGRSALAGRSVCDGCGRELRAVELVPILSWAVQRGRCRGCGARIDPRHPLIEVAAGLIGLLAMVVAPGWAGAAGALFGWALLLLAVLDVEHQWLPDVVTLPLLAAGLAIGAAGLAPPLLDRAIGAAAGYASLQAIRLGYRVIRKREGMGGGDPKLFAAIGAWLGWAMLPITLVVASVAGLGAVLIAVVRGRPIAATTRLPLGALLAVAAYPAWLVMIGTGG